MIIETILLVLLAILCVFSGMVAFVYSDNKWTIWKVLHLVHFILSLIVFVFFLHIFLKHLNIEVSHEEAKQEIVFSEPESNDSPKIVSVFSWDSGVIEVR